MTESAGGRIKRVEVDSVMNIAALSDCGRDCQSAISDQIREISKYMTRPYGVLMLGKDNRAEKCRHATKET